MKISFLFPEKNQGEKLIRHLKEMVLPFLDKQPIAYDVLICPNGCSEEEMELLEEAKKELPLQVRVLKNVIPGGKGAGIKEGIKEAQSDFVLFMDADMATDLEVLNRFLPLLPQYDCILASRDMPDSVYVQRQPFRRRLAHWLGRIIIKMKLHMPFKDTQCGFKAYRTSVAKVMVRHQKFNGFSFDLEYLYFLTLNGFRCKEIGCKWKDDPDSTISKRSVFISFYQDLKQIKKNKKTYLLSKEEKEELGGRYAH